MKSRLEALNTGSASSEDPVHARIDGVLRNLAVEEVEVIGRWYHEKTAHSYALRELVLIPGAGDLILLGSIPTSSGSDDID